MSDSTCVSALKLEKLHCFFMLLMWYLKIELNICYLKVRYQGMDMESKKKMFLLFLLMQV